MPVSPRSRCIAMPRYRENYRKYRETTIPCSSNHSTAGNDCRRNAEIKSQESKFLQIIVFAKQCLVVSSLHCWFSPNEQARAICMHYMHTVHDYILQGAYIQYMAIVRAAYGYGDFWLWDFICSSGIVVVSSIMIPETVSLSWFQFQVSHSTIVNQNTYVHCVKTTNSYRLHNYTVTSAS